ncbi:MAG: type II toxin-antitoxin system PemK/MazF family toxin [Sphingobacteriaceae bacterium]|nr:MAG: type II toxin-antitoxin system PemK/MazF family toxin [Sphingobacteriaceae bacterium]
MYKQGDIVVVRYPLSDKPEKSIIRPVVVVSNKTSNDLDKDLLVCQVTTTLRNNKFSFLLEDKFLTVPMPQICEARCNKIATVRIWDKIVLNKISTLTPEGLEPLLYILRSVFEDL